MLSRFHLIPERNGQTGERTDVQTDRFAISTSRVSMLTHDKNWPIAKNYNQVINHCLSKTEFCDRNFLKDACSGIMLCWKSINNQIKPNQMISNLFY